MTKDMPEATAIQNNIIKFLGNKVNSKITLTVMLLNRWQAACN